MSFAKAQSDWLAALNSDSPDARIQHRLLLKAHGSEFGYRRVYDPRQVAVSSALARTLLIGPDAVAAGSRKLVIPSDHAAIIEELAYDYREASNGTITTDIENSRLELAINGEALSRFPDFVLANYHKSSQGDGLMFGMIPVGIIVPPRAKAELFLTGGGGGDSMTVRVSLTIRFEPLWLMREAGLVEFDEPEGHRV